MAMMLGWLLYLIRANFTFSSNSIQLDTCLNIGYSPRESVIFAKCELKRSAVIISYDIITSSSIKTILYPIGLPLENMSLTTFQNFFSLSMDLGSIER